MKFFSGLSHQLNLLNRLLGANEATVDDFKKLLKRASNPTPFLEKVMESIV